ncbi:Tartrate dehydratase beta subunit/Fumarate hydratase class I, C-terminal domain [butyrate-producing bacterium SM4/1]|nr:Tartrate dehydratase beta subunit/Fumarate hydratase class I, C-terminal domain [butyrate-producing bacterium SM4/1]
MERYISAPISREDARSLKAGDYVYITGTIYTARDAAHKRMQEALEQGKELPIELDRTSSTIWDLRRRGREDPSAQQALPQPAGWTGTRPSFWIWDWER